MNIVVVYIHVLFVCRIVLYTMMVIIFEVLEKHVVVRHELLRVERGVRGLAVVRVVAIFLFRIRKTLLNMLRRRIECRLLR